MGPERQGDLCNRAGERQGHSYYDYDYRYHYYDYDYRYHYSYYGHPT